MCSARHALPAEPATLPDSPAAEEPRLGPLNGRWAEAVVSPPGWGHTVKLLSREPGRHWHFCRRGPASPATHAEAGRACGLGPRCVTPRATSRASEVFRVLAQLPLWT